MQRVTMVALAATLLVAACGDDDEEIARGPDAYAAALADGIRADQSENSLQASEDEARCIGDRTVGVIGIDELTAVGTPAEVATIAEGDLSELDLTDDQASQIAEITFGCIDTAVAQFIDSFGASDPDAQSCLAESLSEDDLIPLLATSLQGADFSDAESSRLLQDLESTFQACA